MPTTSGVRAVSRSRMNEGLRQIGGLWMSIEKVLGPAFEYKVDGGIDESSNSWCGVQDFDNEEEFTTNAEMCVPSY